MTVLCYRVRPAVWLGEPVAVMSLKRLAMRRSWLCVPLVQFAQADAWVAQFARHQFSKPCIEYQLRGSRCHTGCRLVLAVEAEDGCDDTEAAHKVAGMGKRSAVRPAIAFAI